MSTHLPPPLQRLVSCFPSAKSTRGKQDGPLLDTLDRNRSGVYAGPAAVVREAVATAADAASAKLAAKPLLLRLPAVAFGGTFARREAGGLLVPSGVVCLTFDSLDSEAAAKEARRTVSGDPRTLAAWVAPPPHELDVLVYDVPPEGAAEAADWHKDMCRRVGSEFARLYGLTLDAGSCEIARLRPVSDDPDLYVNEDAEPVGAVPLTPPARPPSALRSSAAAPARRATPTPHVGEGRGRSRPNSNNRPHILEVMPHADKWHVQGGEWHGPCPVCGGDDRCRIYTTPGDAGRGDAGRYVCRRCHASGDAVSLSIDGGASMEDAHRLFGVPLRKDAGDISAALSTQRPPRRNDAPLPAKATDPKKRRPPDGRGPWVYTDEAGHPLSRVVFGGWIGTAKQFAQQHAIVGADGVVTYRNGMTAPDGTPVRRVPYNLPAVRCVADAGGVVVVVEGEKCADVFAAAIIDTPGPVAVTTSPGGSGAWRDEYADAFKGAACVVILLDLDAPGEKYAQKVAESCISRGVPVRVVRLDRLPDGAPMPEAGDVADYLEAGGTGADVLAAIEAAPMLRTAHDVARTFESDASVDAAPGKTLGYSTEGMGEDAPPSGKQGRTSVAARLVELVTTAPGVELWHTDDSTEYATVQRSGKTATGEASPERVEHLPIRSKAFRDFLAFTFYRADGRSLGGQAMQDAVDQLAGIARFDGPVHPVALRCATTDGGRTVWIDLGGESTDAVRVTGSGWTIVPADACPVRLLRRANGTALPVPVRAAGAVHERLARLWDFVPAEGERDRAMLLAWMLHALRGAGKYPVLSFAGEAGSGKSTSARLVRALLDPNTVPLRGVPRDEQSLYIAATNGHVLTMDNVSGLSGEMSDALCRLALGGGLSVRQLYTADEERTFQAERPVILTSVADVVARQDLVDRTLCVTLRRIGETARRSDADLNAEFANAAPALFGALLDALSLGLRRWPQVQPGGPRRPSRLPRMADFALWGTATEEALGLPLGGFARAYESARADLVGAALDGDPLADALRTLCDEAGPGGLRATASTLLGLVSDTAGLADANARRLPPGWPRTANALSRQVKELAPGLRAVGVAVDFARDTDRSRARYIVLSPCPASTGQDAAPSGATSDVTPAAVLLSDVAPATEAPADDDDFFVED